MEKERRGNGRCWKWLLWGEALKSWQVVVGREKGKEEKANVTFRALKMASQTSIYIQGSRKKKGKHLPNRLKYGHEALFYNADIRKGKDFFLSPDRKEKKNVYRFLILWECYTDNWSSILRRRKREAFFLGLFFVSLGLCSFSFTRLIDWNHAAFSL